MKKNLLFLGLILLGLCAVAQEKMVNIGVIPMPQKVEMGQGGCKVKDKGLRLCWVDNEKVVKKIIKQGYLPIIYDEVTEVTGCPNQNEAYQIVIEPEKVTIRFSNLQAIHLAQATLSQLVYRYRNEPEVPCMTITDWPAFSYRGWLDDISRGPIASKSFRELQYFTLSLFKMNFGSYYTEHASYNPEFPDLIPPFDRHSRDVNNDSVFEMANLQCLAHFEKTLRIPFYQEMMDTKSNVNPGSEKTYEFLRKQIANVWNQTEDHRFFNINCDETEGLGSGRAHDYVLSKGAANAYCEHINRVYDIVMEEHNKIMETSPWMMWSESEKPEVLMWGDIVGKDPEMLKKLPKEMNYVVWSYVGQENYNSMLEPFRKLHQEQGTPFWVAPGVSHWSSTPQVRNYIQNIANLARDGYLAGARGLINTAWDDSGESLFADSWHAMLWSCEMAWNPIKNTDREKAKEELAMREKMFNENFNQLYRGAFKTPRIGNYVETGMEEQDSDILDLASMIYAVGDLNSNKWVGDWFNTGTLMQPLENFYPSNVDAAMLKRCDEVDKVVGEVLTQIDKDLLPHFVYACNRILRVSEKSRLRVYLYRALNSGEDGDIAKAKNLSEQYLKHLHELKNEYLRLWDEECEAYFRDEICARYDKLGQEVLDAFNHVFISTTTKEGRNNPMVEMKTIEKDLPIYYTLDGRKPSKGSMLYKGPFALDRSCLVKAVTFNKWDERFDSEQYLLCHKGMGHLWKLNTEYSDYKEVYSGGGINALADGQLGSDDTYADGHWQGYWGKDIDVDFDFGSVMEVNNINMRFLQNVFDWILSPETIEVFTSKDGKNWTLYRSEKYFPDFHLSGAIIHTNAIRDLGLRTRYIKILVKNPGKLPQWHPAAGWDSYLFIDEIVIE